VTASRAAFARPARLEPDPLTAALDLGALIGLGWDPETQLLTLDPSHPLVDYAVCKVVGCGNEARRADGLWFESSRVVYELVTPRLTLT
jgi:hypothetical protein